MSSSAVEVRLQFNLLFWYGVMTAVLLLLGVLLAANQILVALVIMGGVWMMTLPYHDRLALNLATATFASALIVPFLPGRPYLWEVGALLAWTGVTIALLLRRYPESMPREIHEHRLVFFGAALFCIVMVVTMFVRGAGLRVLGSGQMGGRYYLQQILCAIFPLLFLTQRVSEKHFVRLFTLQWLLAGTYLFSDFAFTLAPGHLSKVLYFLELPNDAMHFEIQSIYEGVRRYQSLAFAGQGAIFILLIYFGIRDYFGRHSFWLIPVTLGILGVSLLSGHRWVVVIPTLAVVIFAWVQRFLTPPKAIMAAFLGLLVYALLLGFSDKLPIPAQRAVSFLPGLKIDYHASIDASSTLHVRREMFKIGLQMIPDYLWVGRGFTRYIDDRSTYWDPTTITFHINQGKFYNGFVGLMVNTGLFGTLGFLLFVIGGSRAAWKIIRLLRQHGCEDPFARACGLLASLWFAHLFAYFFLHGDSEWAMRRFALWLGMLLIGLRLLRQRVEAAAGTEEEADETREDSAVPVVA